MAKGKFTAKEMFEQANGQGETIDKFMGCKNWGEVEKVIQANKTK